MVTVFNHDAWSGRIKHLVNEVLEIERRLSSSVDPVRRTISTCIIWITRARRRANTRKRANTDSWKAATWICHRKSRLKT